MLSFRVSGNGWCFQEMIRESPKYPQQNCPALHLIASLELKCAFKRQNSIFLWTCKTPPHSSVCTMLDLKRNLELGHSNLKISYND